MVEAIKQDAVPKSEVLAQQHLIRECKVTLKKVESSVCKITGEVRDKYMYEVVSTLPLQNVLEVLRVEERLKLEEYAVAMRGNTSSSKENFLVTRWWKSTTGRNS
ncbi:uncharacterized protein [Eurosta solidaginis]|uniref:uncharacterized protein n=1 Tax=Eurosta solidaginis TaxID=178769 RepID=UPI003530BAB8